MIRFVDTFFTITRNHNNSSPQFLSYLIWSLSILLWTTTGSNYDWLLFLSSTVFSRFLSSIATDFFFTTNLVVIWTAAYIPYRYPRKCLLNLSLHGNACWCHSDVLVSKNLHLSFSYPRKRLFNTQRRFGSNNRISAEKCLWTRFPEMGLPVTILMLGLMQSG
jgi:hypothetical protein